MKKIYISITAMLLVLTAFLAKAEQPQYRPLTILRTEKVNLDCYEDTLVYHYQKTFAKASQMYVKQIRWGRPDTTYCAEYFENGHDTLLLNSTDIIYPQYRNFNAKGIENDIDKDGYFDLLMNIKGLTDTLGNDTSRFVVIFSQNNISYRSSIHIDSLTFYADSIEHSSMLKPKPNDPLFNINRQNPTFFITANREKKKEEEKKPESKQFFNVYPNPTDGRIIIEPLELAGKKGHSKLQVINAEGKLVFEEKVNFNNGAFLYEGGNLTNGVYFLRILDDKNILIQDFKIMKVR